MYILGQERIDMAGKQTISIVLDWNVAKALKAEAARRDRSMSWIVNRLLGAALLEPRTVVIEEVLPGDPDWGIVRGRQREQLSDFDAYHLDRRKKVGRRKTAVGG
jgi:hypothetical protein